uniref:N-acetyltransferase domain-containing protein n=1 Tax=Trieres chinensis TaxID=1514140 RepID=A0A7S1Z674_TRICV|mmetsp:Transcript_18631/g.37749  ORF Transcript_18631/g.37749 Transcript_18631/m.37749 type:complete len:301 (+) Transcript_18631:55-957(+)
MTGEATSVAADGLSSLSLKRDAEGDLGRRPDDTGDQEEDAIPGIRFVDYRDESQLEAVMRLVGRDLSEPYSIFTYRYFLHQFPDLCILAVPDVTPDIGGAPPEPIGCVVCKIDEEEVAGGGIEGSVSAHGAGVAGDDNALAREKPDVEMADAADSEGGDGQAGGEDETSNPPPGSGGEGSTTPSVVHLTDATGDMDGGDTEAGAALTRPTTSSTIRRSGYMAMLAVDTSYRRSGIGTALVRRAVRRMQRRGCESVTLETEVSNEAAMRLYEDRLGFIREELLVRYYLNWGDAYRLRLWFD